MTLNKSMKDVKKEKSLKDGNAMKTEDHQSVQKSQAMEKLLEMKNVTLATKLVMKFLRDVSMVKSLKDGHVAACHLFVKKSIMMD